jgi:mono/diheme cytochrome c family protein
MTVMMKSYLCLFFLLICSQCFSQAKQSATGKDIYTKYCLTCHQQDGKGVPKLNPPLIHTSYVTGDTKTLITWVIKGSGEEKVPIDGIYYNNNMPPQSFLKDDELAKVLTYIRSSFGNKAGAVSSAEVKAVRAGTK